MPDLLDAVEGRERLILEASIKGIRTQSAQQKQKPKGSCYYCDEPFLPESEQLFCDKDCSDDYQKYILKQR